ncbi:50S ribosomal protein L12 [Durusdinium trenchii]|uniref:Chloroplastic n=1 Tax=Durusdinium trenchii TaxID=1381693 RepID=A0ABP0KCX6_9DINO
MAGADMDLAASESGIFLDTTSFRHFAPLLEASQAYAQLSGCRFRLASFGPGHPLPAPSEGQPSRDKSLRLAAKVQAEPQVQVFSERLLAGDPQLTEELDRAFRVVMVEGVRNAMMAAFQRLELWPPRPAPEGIEEDDCCYEDVNSPLPVIAQRLYNDDVRRLMAVPCDGAASPWQQRALTAAFIVDFAEEVGLPCLSMPPTQQEMIEEFALRVEEYEAQQRAESAALDAIEDPSPQAQLEPEAMPSEASAQTASASLLTAAQQLREETRKLRERGGLFVQENKAALALGAVGLVGGAVAALAAGGAIMATRLSRSQDDARQEDDEGLERKADTGRWLVASPVV